MKVTKVLIATPCAQELHSIRSLNTNENYIFFEAKTASELRWKMMNDRFDVVIVNDTLPKLMLKSMMSHLKLMDKNLLPRQIVILTENTEVDFETDPGKIVVLNRPYVIEELEKTLQLPHFKK